MQSTPIKNVVFDIGNVIVRWDPPLIAARAFGAERATPEFIQQLLHGPIWRALNRGELTEAEGKAAYRAEMGFSEAEADALFFHIKDSLTLIPETLVLMEALRRAGYDIYALSDNVHELVTYLKARHDFWRYFVGAVISAEIGLLKPSAEIYQHLLDTHGLNAGETVFLDDMIGNVEGAQAMGIHALHFTDTATAVSGLRTLGLVFD